MSSQLVFHHRSFPGPRSLPHRPGVAGPPTHSHQPFAVCSAVPAYSRPVTRFFRSGYCLAIALAVAPCPDVTRLTYTHCFGFSSRFRRTVSKRWCSVTHCSKGVRDGIHPNSQEDHSSQLPCKTNRSLSARLHLPPSRVRLHVDVFFPSVRPQHVRPPLTVSFLPTPIPTVSVRARFIRGYILDHTTAVPPTPSVLEHHTTRKCQRHYPRSR